MSSSPDHPLIQDTFNGQIILIIGPMMSEKTSMMIRLIHRHGYAKRTALVIKPLKDTRYSIKQVQSHINPDGLRLSIDSISTDDIYNIEEVHADGTITSHNPLDYDVIAIDEGNFFKPNLIQFAEDMANHGKIVIITALNGDIHQKHLGHISELYPYVDHIEHLKSVCHDCGKDAPFTWSDVHREEGKIVVGGADIYRSLCRYCRNMRRLAKIMSEQQLL